MDHDNASTVAIVDNDDDVRDVLCVLLESAGHSVETYKSGSDCLTNARLDEIACLVVDQRMPEMRGATSISTVARRGMTIPSFPITGAQDAAIARAADKPGAMTVLEKPLSAQELRRFVSFPGG